MVGKRSELIQGYFETVIRFDKIDQRVYNIRNKVFDITCYVVIAKRGLKLGVFWL